MFIEKYVYTMFRLDWLLHEGHLCPLRNVLPEAVYCCFTTTTLFTRMFSVMIVVCLLKSMCIPSVVLIGCCMSGPLCPLRNVLPEAVYCCFTRTTLFSNLLHVCMIRVRGCFHITKFRYSTPSGF